MSLICFGPLTIRLNLGSKAVCLGLQPCPPLPFLSSSFFFLPLWSPFHCDCDCPISILERARILSQPFLAQYVTSRRLMRTKSQTLISLSYSALLHALVGQPGIYYLRKVFDAGNHSIQFLRAKDRDSGKYGKSGGPWITYVGIAPYSNCNWGFVMQNDIIGRHLLRVIS